MKKTTLKNMFTFHKRADGSYFGFSENTEGWLCYLGYLVTFAYTYLAIITVIAKIVDKVTEYKGLIKSLRNEKVESITDNGPVMKDAEVDFNKINAFQEMHDEMKTR